MSLRNLIVDNFKNIPGWRTGRKLVVFSVDDYGNVRVSSKRARENMNRAGLKIYNQFDAFDSLETKEDLEYLFEILTSVKDKKGKSAVFTPFALPCNIDFDAVEESGFENYFYEKLPDTYSKLTGIYPKDYEGTWTLWREGIKSGLMAPQFHGREHLNLKVFEEKLQSKDLEILTVLKNRSYTSISNSGYPSISVTAAFDFFEMSENLRFREIISSGISYFEEVYGYKPIYFNAPGAAASSQIEEYLVENGIKYSDNPIVKKEHLGKGKYKTNFNYTGKLLRDNLINVNRNVVFEPAASLGIDWAGYALNQIETAFFWGKPAVISSHRVNFCGLIDKKNRENGLFALKKLLKRLINRHPDVEFISAAELGELINE